MQVAGAEIVLGDFSDVAFEIFATVTRFLEARQQVSRADGGRGRRAGRVPGQDR
jgi:hypothetical protein